VEAGEPSIMLSHFVVRPSTSLAAGAGGTSMLASGAERLPILSRLTSFSPPFGAAVRHRRGYRTVVRRVVARRRR